MEYRAETNRLLLREARLIFRQRRTARRIWGSTQPRCMLELARGESVLHPLPNLAYRLLILEPFQGIELIEITRFPLDQG